jgi:hypothetical protein
MITEKIKINNLTRRVNKLQRKDKNVNKQLQNMTLNRQQPKKRKNLKKRNNNNSKVTAFKRNYTLSRNQHLMNLLDPWNATGAKLPQIGDIYSNVAKVRSYFNLTANANGYFLAVFDPSYIASAKASGTLTAFNYCRNATLNGSTAITGTNLWNYGPVGSVPMPPLNTVLKARLVCAGMKVVPKISTLNYVATAITCIDYSDSQIGLATTAFTATDEHANYGVFANVMYGNGGKKFDLTPTTGNNAIYFNWYPTDPLAEVFIDQGEEIVDIDGHEAGGFQKFVIAFQDLPASATIDFEIVWNIEYLCNPIAKPWAGVLNNPVSRMDHEEVMNELQNMGVPIDTDTFNLFHKNAHKNVVSGIMEKR